MTPPGKRPNPLQIDEEPPVILSFIDPDGNVVARKRGIGVQIPEIGTEVSFGTLTAPTREAIGTEAADFSMNDTRYRVHSIEQTYSTIELEEESISNDDFIVVTVYVQPVKESPGADENIHPN